VIADDAFAAAADDDNDDEDEDDGDDDDDDHAKDAKDATCATYLVHLHAFTVVDFAAFRFTRKRRRAFQNPRLRSLKAS